MTVSLKYLGTAAFEITTAEGKRILIDPYLDENPVSPIKVDDIDSLDLLLVTHSAYDHLGDTEKIMRRLTDVPLICGADVRGYLMHRGIEEHRLHASPWGMKIEKVGIGVRPIYSRHWSFIQTEDGLSFSSVPLGFIIDVGDGIRVYHAGDTMLYSDMKLYGELYQPTIGLINVGVPENHRGAEHGVTDYLTGEMDSIEAVMACQWWGLKYAIPCHHDNPELPEIVRFKELLEEAQKEDESACEPVVLAPGATFTL
jgi:L-ascorbate metabolism protein UlaG (beta-lactamase superfamily)